MSPTRSPIDFRPKHIGHRGAALAAAAVLLVGAGCGSESQTTATDDPAPATQPDTSPPEPVDSTTPPTDPGPATTTAGTTVPATDPTTTINATTTTVPTTEPVVTSTEPDDDEHSDGDAPIAQASAVAATSEGVFVTDGSGAFTVRVLDDTTQGLALLAADLVIYQAGTGNDFFRTEGPIIVADAAGAAEFTDGDRALRLHDVGTIDGRTKILASSQVAQPANPDQADHRLLLIDADDVIEGTDVRVDDLGSFGGWEAGVGEARFGEGAISLIHNISAASDLEIIEYDGTIRHDIALPSERNWSLVDFDESIWVTDAAFATPDFDEFLDIRQVDLTDGTVREATIDLDFPFDRDVDGFCDNIDFLDGKMLCDQTRGAPFTFPIDDPTVTLIPGLDNGTVRYRASQ